jgi:hypothetical protein
VTSSTTESGVRVPTDLKGLKFRTTASPVEIAMFRNWGAIATAIDWAEVYNALGSGVVDGEFVMPTWLSTAKHYEVLKYATENKAVIGIQTLAVRTERFAEACSGCPEDRSGSRERGGSLREQAGSGRQRRSLARTRRSSAYRPTGRPKPK